MDSDLNLLAYAMVAFGIIAVVLWHILMVFLGGLIILVPFGWFVHAHPRIRRPRLMRSKSQRRPKDSRPPKPRKPRRPSITRQRRTRTPSAVLRIGEKHPNDRGEA